MGIITLPGNRKTAFYKEGFNNWGKAVEHFKVHEKSELHKEAVYKIASLKTPTVSKQLSTEA